MYTFAFQFLVYLLVSKIHCFLASFKFLLNFSQSESLAEEIFLNINILFTYSIYLVSHCYGEGMKTAFRVDMGWNSGCGLAVGVDQRQQISGRSELFAYGTLLFFFGQRKAHKKKPANNLIHCSQTLSSLHRNCESIMTNLNIHDLYKTTLAICKSTHARAACEGSTNTYDRYVGKLFCGFRPLYRQLD